MKMSEYEEDHSSDDGEGEDDMTEETKDSILGDNDSEAPKKVMINLSIPSVLIFNIDIHSLSNLIMRYRRKRRKQRKSYQWRPLGRINLKQ